MGFAEAISTCFRRYFDFSGRAVRSEYWWFVLFVLASNLALSAIEQMTWSADPSGVEPTILTSMFALATLIPTLAVTARRLHDIGRSGWWQTLPYAAAPVSLAAAYVLWLAIVAVADVAGAEPIPFLSSFLQLAALGVLGSSLLLLLWWLTRPSEPGPNKYGPNPHEVTP